MKLTNTKMPLVSKELNITFNFPENRVTIDRLVTPQPGHKKVSNITPHFYMQPIPIEGVIFGPVERTKTNSRIHFRKDDVYIRPALQADTELAYNTAFAGAFDPHGGTVIWTIGHPTERLTVFFDQGEWELFWNITYLDGKNTDLSHELVTADDGNLLAVSLDDGVRGGQIVFQWTDSIADRTAEIMAELQASGAVN